MDRVLDRIQINRVTGGMDAHFGRIVEPTKDILILKTKMLALTGLNRNAALIAFYIFIAVTANHFTLCRKIDTYIHSRELRVCLVYNIKINNQRLLCQLMAYSVEYNLAAAPPIFFP